jgi:hypothetical protein
MQNRSKKFSMFATGLALTVILSTAALAAGDMTSSKPVYLYKTTFVRAAPGKLLDLIALYKDRMAIIEASGDARPFWWRHTQGDQWDLMLLTPMGGYAEYYSKARTGRRDKVSGPSLEEFARKLNSCSSWREDVFVMGPPLEFVRKAFEGSAYYHIEIFISLPGKQEELFKEREMENTYAVETGRPYNMIFIRDQGAAWDLFTLGCYRDIKHWAVGDEVTKEQRAAAARKAGFNSPDEIGPYMRTLIDMHRDTMGVAIK